MVDAMVWQRILSLALLCLASCASSGDSERIPKVLLFGVDGLRSDELAAANTPAMDALSGGALRRLDGTNAWLPDEPSNGHSAPNWTAILTGHRPSVTEVAVNGDGEHLVDDDTWEAGRIRTVFGHVKAAHPEAHTFAFHTWGGIGVAEGTILGRSKTVLDEHFLPEAGPTSAERDDEIVERSILSLSQGDPDLAFVYFSECDAAGHEFTYQDPDYRQSIESVDRKIALVLAALEARPTREGESWLILLTSDHGGPSETKNHADNGDVFVRTVPVLGRADGRVLGRDGAVSVYDITPTILEWLGAEAADSFDGRSLLQ